jgi:phosphopantothenoylcysteine decarboxylase/phosphopantothenate--cysteine ligase
MKNKNMHGIVEAFEGLNQDQNMAPVLGGKKILLALTGGIACYKSAELCRELKKCGADVRVVMTHGACEFISPLTLQALSGNEVHTQLLDPDAEAGMSHIQLARWPDLVLIAPASANFIAKYHAGMADDLLTTLLMATVARVCIAPAMNQAMWGHPLTQRNIAELSALMGPRLSIIGPADGEQACGDVGPGRLMEPLQILAAIESILEPATGMNMLAGKRIVITAGPTREAIDPVRYISNHSSGKMGYALASVCKRSGADVILVSGPCQLKAELGVEVIPVDSALEMYSAVHTQLDLGCDVFIGCAAVADYRPVNRADKKIKKSEAGSTQIVITLEQNPDILASVADRKDKPYTVGFAAETHDVLKYAREKRQRKQLDLIIANDISKEGQGFNSELNEVCLISQHEERLLALEHKSVLAEKIVAYISEQLSDIHC